MIQYNQASPWFTAINTHSTPPCLCMIRLKVSSLTQGVICFDYCHDLGLLVTGSVDHTIQLWDPYVPSRPMAVLSGHASAVLDVIINRDLGLVFSCSQDCVSWVGGRGEEGGGKGGEEGGRREVIRIVLTTPGSSP